MTDDAPANPITAQELIAQLEFEPWDADDLDGGVVVDAVVILRYQAPDWYQPRTTFVSTKGMDSVLRYGIVGCVWDRISTKELAAWEDE